MRLPRILLLALALPALGAAAEERRVEPGPGALAAAVAEAQPGDVLILQPGHYDGPVTLDRPVTLDGQGQAEIQGPGTGSVITITGADVTVRGVHVTGSGSSQETIDAGIKLTKVARDAVIEDNVLLGNLHGIDLHGANGTVIRGNTVVGRQDHRMNARGNGVYIWNTSHAVVERNDIRYGRDGIFSNISRDNVYRDNLFRDLRFAVHYMYTNNSEVSGNVSIGNHLGFALMFSDRLTVRDNLSLGDISYGLMLNYANHADITGNLVRGGAGKCLFVFNAQSNLIAGNRFEGCAIGIHFTAGSERNALTLNAFIGNQTQVKYVGTRDVEWSLEGRGNYWSDHPAFDLDGDGLADGRFRPNDLMDQILWSQPAAALLIGSPAVQLVRWSQANFPATLPGGVVDSHPLMAPIEIAVPDNIAAMEAEARLHRPETGVDDADAELLAGH
ncbi:nitrous oxide reductase family maturation protein NosD [Rubellimicrobium arenae]|uniref:nitrous oxide reductase family maturation protein NosD n=1 Tax=Rubellimicrobium arenae TaxID=2817372 RepID=UPI001B304F2B|nr:nitrous oxide reductase family maturation protein NosD [Rubellimicrobium arenae]